LFVCLFLKEFCWLFSKSRSFFIPRKTWIKSETHYRDTSGQGSHCFTSAKRTPKVPLEGREYLDFILYIPQIGKLSHADKGHMLAHVGFSTHGECTAQCRILSVCSSSIYC
jgi:hypothetical protein